MNFSQILALFFSLFLFNQVLFAQKKRKVKPIFFGTIQGAYIFDNFIPESNTSFNYLNLGIRKVSEEKVQEIGLESYTHKQEYGVVIENIGSGLFVPTEGTIEEVFNINLHWYLGLKQWQFSKLKIGMGPKFALGYYRKEIIPISFQSFPILFNDFKIGASGKIEVTYTITQRFSILASTQYTFFQFGVRRIRRGNPTLDERRQLEDFIQVDFLVNRYIAQLGVIAQFGKIKKDRTKIKKKRDKKRQNKKDKLQKQKAKKQKKKEKAKTKKSKAKKRK